MIIRKSHPLFKILNGVLVDLPSPPNISTFWNFGSLLGLTLVIQIITGLLLATRYVGGISAFDSVIYIFQDVNHGWLIRLLHSTIASFFFLFLYFHIGRGLYYGSYAFSEVWNLGVAIYFILIGTAFLGYVLPWGQISYWAATVITNLLSAVPYLGGILVEWVWGGFAVSYPTLSRFYILHFLLPFVILFLVVLHIFFLHTTGSSNPLGLNSSSLKLPFHYYYTIKDIVGFVFYFFILFLVSFTIGYVLIDSENFIISNPLVTPTHIQPEWYFLFAYAILRSIPNKLGGVIALVCSIAILFLLPFSGSTYVNSTRFSVLKRLIFWVFVVCFILLTWLGIMPAEYPYTRLSLLITIAYFASFFLLLRI